MKVISFLFKRSPSRLVLAIITSILSGAANTALLALIAMALDPESAWGLPSEYLMAAFVGFCLLVPITRITSELLLVRFSQEVIYELRLEIGRKILAVPLRHLEKLGSGRFMAVLTEDLSLLTEVFTLISSLAFNIAVLLGCLVFLGWMSWKLLLTVVIFLIFGALTYRLPISRAMVYFHQAIDERNQLFAHYRALLDGVKELKLNASRRRSFLVDTYRATAEAFRRAAVTAQKIYVLASNWGQLLVFVVIGLLLFAGPVDDTGTLTSFILILLYVMTPLQVLMNSLPNLGRATVALERVEELGLDLTLQASEDIEKVPTVEPRWHRLELLGVEHSYRGEDPDQRFRLGPIDLELKPGEIVMVAGGNGSGKTTLAKVLVGLYTPEGGKIRLDGQLVDEEGIESYRQRFAVIFSDFFLFDVLHGLEHEELDSKAREYLEVLRLENKLSIQDGRFSTTDLSQGQRKRLALLTAFLEDRPIYVFDEWAADQDPTFREFFYQQLLPEIKRRGKTAIVISHDDRYYEVGDRLIKLEYGKIIEDTALTAARLA